MYDVEYSRQAIKILKKIPRDTQTRIVTALSKLAIDPYAANNVKKLVGEDAFRLRVGTWRIIYELRDEALIVMVLDIGQRKEIYR